MFKPARTILSCVLALIFLFSFFMLTRQTQDKSKGSDTYTDALQLAYSGDALPSTAAQPQRAETGVPQSAETLWVPAAAEDDETVQDLEALSLENLRQVNPDVIGWILIPDIQVNYPIMQGEDNDFYLNHTWKGDRNSVGSIFLEYRNAPELTDFHTIIYGHNMSNGSMFAPITHFDSQQYWEQHPYIYIRTDTGVFRYEIFSSYQADVTGSAYMLNFNREEARTAFLEEALKNSRIDTGIVPAPTDRILTLSTCSGMGYSTRWVVHARLRMIPSKSK